MKRDAHPSLLQPWSPAHLPGPGSIPVTVLILTLDEAVNIERCIDSVGWADQVIVVDSGSTDGTQDLAAAHGAKVLFHEFEDYGSQRQWALERTEIRNEWILFVDADEWVSRDLARDIASAIPHAEHDGYAVRFRLIWNGRWIRHAGWYSGSWIVRLARRSRGHISGGFSERLAVDGSVGSLGSDIVDEDRKPFSRWQEKHNRYSSLQAQMLAQLRRQPFLGRIRRVLHAQPPSRIPREVIKQLILPHLPLSPIWVFLYLYVVRRGFLDGRQGLWFCALHAAQDAAVRVKLAEMEGRNPSEGGPNK